MPMPPGVQRLNFTASKVISLEPQLYSDIFCDNGNLSVVLRIIKTFIVFDVFDIPMKHY